MPCLNLFVVSQLFDGLPHQRVEVTGPGGKLCPDRPAHPRIPEFQQMIGDRRDGCVTFLGLKEAADLIGHMGQLVRRHAAPLPG